MELTLQEMLGIVESDFINEVWCIVATVALHLIAYSALVLVLKACGAFRQIGRLYRNHPFALALAIPFIIYGAVKLVPSQEQCDYRVGEDTDVTDGRIGYVMMTGDAMPTNIDVVCCGGAVTNELTFTHTGQFYIETHQYDNPDFAANPV